MCSRCPPRQTPSRQEPWRVIGPSGYLRWTCVLNRIFRHVGWSVVLVAAGVRSLSCAQTASAFDARGVQDATSPAELTVASDVVARADVTGVEAPGWVRCGAMRCAPEQLCVFRRDGSSPGHRCVPRGSPPTPVDSNNLLAYCDGPEDCPAGESCKDITSNFPSLQCRPTSTPCFRGERRLCQTVSDCPTCDRPLNPAQACNPLRYYPVSLCLF